VIETLREALDEAAPKGRDGKAILARILTLKLNGPEYENDDDENDDGGEEDDDDDDDVAEAEVGGGEVESTAERLQNEDQAAVASDLLVTDAAGLELPKDKHVDPPMTATAASPITALPDAGPRKREAQVEAASAPKRLKSKNKARVDSDDE